MGLLGLGFPVLLLALLLFIFIWFWVNKKVFIGLLLLGCLGYQNIRVSFAWNKSAPFSQTKPAGTIRILGYNVRGFDTKDKRYDSTQSYRWRILDYIRQQQADILCLQDYTEYHNEALPTNDSYLKDTLGYPFYYFASDYKEYPPWGPSFSGIAIYSRIPLNNIQHVLYTGKETPESMIITDVTVNGATKRIIVTHLQSIHLRNESVQEYEPWHKIQDSAIIYSNNKFKKLDYYLPYHAQQSEALRQQIEKSPYPVIFSADMNEVPTSYVYHNVTRKLNDVFLMKGSGLGRTYYRISPTLRIDYLLVSPGIEVVQYKKDDLFMSDHYPQVMDIKW